MILCDLLTVNPFCTTINYNRSALCMQHSCRHYNVDNIHCTIKKQNFRERKKFKNLLVNEVAADKMKINAPL